MQMLRSNRTKVLNAAYKAPGAAGTRVSSRYTRNVAHASTTSTATRPRALATRRMMSLHAAKQSTLHLACEEENDRPTCSASSEPSTTAQPLADLHATVPAQGDVVMECAPAGALPALQRIRSITLGLPLPAPGRPVERLWWGRPCCGCRGPTAYVSTDNIAVAAAVKGAVGHAVCLMCLGSLRLGALPVLRSPACCAVCCIRWDAVVYAASIARQAAMCSEQAQGHLSKVRLPLHVSLSLSVSGLCHEPWLTRGDVHPAPAHRRTAVCLQHSKEDARNAQGPTWARARHLASQGSSAAATPSTGAGRPRAAASARASAQRILPFCRRHVQRTCMHGLFTSATQKTGRVLRSQE